MTEPAPNFVSDIARAICDAEWGRGHWDSDAISQDECAAYDEMARAAIRAYEAHSPRPFVVLTLQEWEDAQNAARRVHRTHGFEVQARAAFPWIKVEGD